VSRLPASQALKGANNRPRENVQKIFAPLITEIQKLVDEQVNLVKIKRMTERHPMAQEIKVPQLPNS
jgi:hypothetical protein